MVPVYGIQLASRIRKELQFRPDPARKPLANLYDMYHCCAYSEKLLMMERGTVRKSRVLFQKLIWEISAPSYNSIFESVEEFKCLGTTLTNQNSIAEEIKSRLRSGSACYHSVQNLLSSRLLSENLKIKI